MRDKVGRAQHYLLFVKLWKVVAVHQNLNVRRLRSKEKMYLQNWCCLLFQLVILLLSVLICYRILPRVVVVSTCPFLNRTKFSNYLTHVSSHDWMAIINLLNDLTIFIYSRGHADILDMRCSRCFQYLILSYCLLYKWSFQWSNSFDLLVSDSKLAQCRFLMMWFVSASTWISSNLFDSTLNRIFH